MGNLFDEGNASIRIGLNLFDFTPYYKKLNISENDVLYNTSSSLSMTDHGMLILTRMKLYFLYFDLSKPHLEFPLKDITKIIDSPQFDRSKALEQQINLLTLKKEHIENLINLARGINKVGVKQIMDFTAFDTKQIDEYAAQAKEAWGDTDAYKEFAEKSKNRTSDENVNLAKDMMKLFTEFGGMKDLAPDSTEVQKQVRKLQSFITDNMYNCTNEILSGLGKAYSAPGEMNDNIDKAGGEGTGAFVDKAIQIYCGK